MSFQVVIPARYASSRLPGKVLADVGGHPLVWWTWRNALDSGADGVCIATESDEVRAVCEAFGAEVVMTSAEHASGTERLSEVITRQGWADETLVVNVQADEPMLPPALIRQVAEGLAADPDAEMATLCEPVASPRALFDPNVVKVVRNARGHAITFSRAPIPWNRDVDFHHDRMDPSHLHSYRRHIGLYAYRAGFVQRYVSWPPCELEQLEKLEQLRALYHEVPILVLDALCDAGIGVDTAEDLERVRQVLG